MLATMALLQGPTASIPCKRPNMVLSHDQSVERSVMPADRLVLGTVQFGLAYGVSHKDGAVPYAEVGRILDLAWQSGARTLDTAAAYGESEQVIGSLDISAGFGVITKTVPIRAAELGAADFTTIEQGFRGSLEKLRRRSVDALLVHNVQNLQGRGGAELWSRLERLRAEGATARIGISVYDVSEAEEAIRRFPVEVVQLPLNVFDQKAVRGGGLERLAARGVIIHARSVFLQGLLLMEPTDLPAHLRQAAPVIERWRANCARQGVTPLAAALGFVMAQPAVAKLVVGVHSREQLSAYLGALGQSAALPWASFACDDPAVIDPRAWSRVWTQ
jgi:aryl-alcohol dehydrogenase-like predicted oxidoreductase